MSLHDFKKSLKGLQRATTTAIKRDVDLSTDTPKNVVFDYDASKAEYYKNSVVNYLADVKKFAGTLNSLLSHDKNSQYIPEVMNLVDQLDVQDLQKMEDVCVDLLLKLDNVKAPSEERITKNPERIPLDIKGEVIADLFEIDRAYRAGCFRSVTILCGRVLETALHRKYYDATGFDILEKNPGIGLGKLIAKMDEKGIRTDPALKNQIHLINQVRVFAVHKKLEPFHPSSAQARAMVIYTNDVLERLF